MSAGPVILLLALTLGVPILAIALREEYRTRQTVVVGPHVTTPRKEPHPIGERWVLACEYCGERYPECRKGGFSETCEGIA